MAEIEFTANIQRHVSCPTADLKATSLKDLLDAYFAIHPQVRTYLLDDQGALRQHMVIFVDGQMISDRAQFSDRLEENSAIHVFQALSGG